MPRVEVEGETYDLTVEEKAEFDRLVADVDPVTALQITTGDFEDVVEVKA